MTMVMIDLDGAGVELSRAGWLPAAQRFGLAAALLFGAAMAASAVMVAGGGSDRRHAVRRGDARHHRAGPGLEGAGAD